MQKEELRVKWGVGDEATTTQKRVAYSDFGIDLPPLPKVSMNAWPSIDIDNDSFTRPLVLGLNSMSFGMAPHNEMQYRTNFSPNKQTGSDNTFNIDEIEKRVNARLFALQKGTSLARDPHIGFLTDTKKDRSIPSSPVSYRPILPNQL